MNFEPIVYHDPNPISHRQRHEKSRKMIGYHHRPISQSNTVRVPSQLSSRRCELQELPKQFKYMPSALVDKCLQESIAKGKKIWFCKGWNHFDLSSALFTLSWSIENRYGARESTIFDIIITLFFYYVIIGLINEGETEMIKSKIKNLNELTKGYANKNSNPLLYGGQSKTETQAYRMDINEYRKLVEKGEATNEPMTCRKILPGEDSL